MYVLWKNVVEPLGALLTALDRAGFAIQLQGDRLYLDRHRVI
jgi:hypothetical protein